MAGALPTVITIDELDDVPQALVAVTVNVPLDVGVSDPVVPVPEGVPPPL